ncbi:universal stress protein [Haloglomus litoreum]|uniref:universal stress protein n=1 Tax=Haloglomus litoreum TaxID=3034026 RepID=UPI0023E87FDC|nr:universal stress protein [Haloglomus sp. DT116]
MSDETSDDTGAEAAQDGAGSEGDDSRKKVLVPIDGSEQSHAALQHALSEFEGATLTLLHVINPARAGYGAQAGIPTSSEEWLEEAEAEADELFAAAEERAHGRDVQLETVTEVGNPSRVIVEFTEDEANGIDHVVMGSHGRSGLSRVLLGSVAENVVRRSTVPVTVVR